MLKEYPYKSQGLVLILSTLLSLGIYLVRVEHANQFYFAFLIWNLFLAWIPYFISTAIVVFKVQKRWIMWAAFCLWLLFLPNSPYIITDYFHLKPRSAAPFWLDLTLISSFAWTGLMLGLASLQQMQEYMFHRMGKAVSWLGTLALLFLCSFGVYLGRFERWNSWDLMTRPDALLQNIAELILHPDKHTLGFTLAFGAFLVVAYLAFALRELKANRYQYT